MISCGVEKAFFSIREITNTEWVPRTFRLRYEVWNLETTLVQSIHKQGLISDEHDTHARHWAAFSRGGSLVASARLCIHDAQEHLPDEYCYTELDLPCPLASINRLVVDQSARNGGIAQQLDLRRIEAAKNAGVACVVVAPTSDSRIQALKKFGFSLKEVRAKSHYLENLWVSMMVLDL